MENDAAEVTQELQNCFSVKVHNSMCRELSKVLNRIISVVPAIESARPGCKSGIQDLCSLNNAIEKAKLLLQYCAESSKLYLAITGEATLLRCERIRYALYESLSQIQTMVPEPLATQIAEIIKGLRNAKFFIDSSSEEAGRMILTLLRQSDSTEDSEFEAFQIAALMLNISSSKAILIERRAVKKLYDKFCGHDSKKEKILNYLLYLLKKYGKRLKSETFEHRENVDALDKSSAPITNFACDSNACEKNDETSEVKLQGGFSCREAQTNLSSKDLLPEEFRCPISSRLMCDPVIIASGQTYERIWIEKWFSEGNKTCPKTQKKMSNLTMIPNSCMKDLISDWCKKKGVSLLDPCSQANSAALCGWDTSNSSLNNVSAVLLDGKTANYDVQSDSSISVLSSDASYYSDSSHVRSNLSSKDSQTQMFTWCEDYNKCQSFSNFSHDMYLGFFSDLSQLPLDCQSKALEDFKIHLSCDETCHSMLSNGFAEALMRYLKDAYDLSNVRAQKMGTQILLAFLSNSRFGISSFGSEDAFNLLASFLNSEITAEALQIIQLLSCHPNCKSYIISSGIAPSIIKLLDSGVTEFMDLVLRILCDLSSNIEIKYQILSSGCVSRLGPLLSNCGLIGNCIKVLHNLCDIEEGAKAIAETNGCIASIAELLDTGNHEEQEHAVAIFLSVCSLSFEYCLPVMKEGVIPSLVYISVNGNSEGKENSQKLLHLLRNLRHNDCLESSLSHSGSSSEPVQNSDSHPTEKQPTSKPSGFFRRRMRFFLKPRSVALF